MLVVASLYNVGWIEDDEVYAWKN